MASAAPARLERRIVMNAFTACCMSPGSFEPSYVDIIESQTVLQEMAWRLGVTQHDILDALFYLSSPNVRIKCIRRGDWARAVAERIALNYGMDVEEGGDYDAENERELAQYAFETFSLRK